MIPKQRVTSETKSAMSETCAVCSKRFAEKWTGCSYCEYKWWCTDGDCYTKKRVDAHEKICKNSR